MIKHIVAWRLKDEALGNSKQQNALLMKQKLEALNSKIPGLIKLELGIDFSKTASSADVVLYAEFSAKEDLDAYVVHPEHKAVGTFVREVVAERRMVDCEV
jgi:hypothetical protein